MSPLLLTHFYYSHRSLPLALWPPLCRSFCLAVYEQSVWLAQTHRRGGEWIKRLEGIFRKIAIYRLVRILEALNVESRPALGFFSLAKADCSTAVPHWGTVDLHVFGSLDAG